MDKCFIISNSDELVRIPPERLVYISSEGNYSTLMLSGEKKHVFTVNLVTFQRLLETQLEEASHQFIRIGKSLIINKNYIYSIHIGKQSLVLADSQFQHHYMLSASREALRQLKSVLESGIKTT